MPALLEQKDKGKIRHIGITENPINDFTNEMLKRAVNDPVWEVYMVGFHMMHQGARKNVFPVTRAKGIGTLLMFAVRSIFADPPRIAREMKALADKGLVEKWLGETDDPLGFLVHAGGASNMIEAAYRYVRHEPGVDVVLFGTGDAGHLRTNVESILKPPLPEADRAEARKAVRPPDRHRTRLPLRRAEVSFNRMLKNSPPSFRDAAKRRARNPDTSGFPAFLDSGLGPIARRRRA